MFGTYLGRNLGKSYTRDQERGEQQRLKAKQPPKGVAVKATPNTKCEFATD